MIYITYSEHKSYADNIIIIFVEKSQCFIISDLTTKKKQ